jgi:GNAT superfamily N-acetyltransferase
MIKEQEKTSQIALLNQEFLTSWQLCTSPFPGVELLNGSEIATRWANIDFRFYNALCLTAELCGERALVQTVCEGIDFMRARPYPGWMVVTRESLSDTAQNALSSLIVSMQLASMPATGMAGEILPLEERVIPNLRFERIGNDDTVITFAELNCLAYGFPVEVGRSVIGANTFWCEHAYGFIAYDGELPVATATGIVCGASIFLFLVATRPEAQRKGYADAVIRRALNAAHAATGIRRTSLQATDAGRPVYRRLGYLDVCRYTCLWPAT